MSNPAPTNGVMVTCPHCGDPIDEAALAWLDSHIGKAAHGISQPSGLKVGFVQEDHVIDTLVLPVALDAP